MDLEKWKNVYIPAEEEQDYTFSVNDGSFKAKLSNNPKDNLTESNDFTLSALVKANPYAEDMKVQAALYLHEKKAELNEVERERRKAQADIIEIDDNGRITVKTLNTRKAYTARILCNFSTPKLVIFSNKEFQVYCISFLIRNDEKRFFIRDIDAGDGKLLLKKFNSVGADFLMDRVGKKINATLQLLALLLRNASEEIVLPPEPGWYTDLFGRMKFCREGELSWEIIMTHI